ncbi:MAG TPA: STAS domain-containing protein [Spirochaetota bacterium]|nr:STAS domain-containing protein [Spirochaetota bacterium]
MEITVAKLLDNAVLMSLRESFDTMEISRFEKIIHENVQEGVKFLVLDFSELAFMDSSAISCLVRNKNLLQKRTVEMVIVDIPHDILNIFKLAYLDRFFTIIKRNNLLKHLDEK